jgi:phosphoesterase RecJ-like protein
MNKVVSKSDCKRFFEILSLSKNIFITGHIHPDADVIGSALAIYLFIKKVFKNKNVDIIFRDQYPEWLKFLPKIEKIKICKYVSKRYDLGIILECSDISRMGGVLDINQLNFIVNIDHHLNHSGINNRLNFVYPEYASCAEIIFDIFKNLNFKIDHEIAECLYVGVVTDTGRFQWSNTTQHSFFTAYKLVGYGLKPYEIYKNLYRRKSYNSMILLGKALSRIRILKIKGIQIGTMSISNRMFQTTKTSAIDTEDFINFPMDILGTKIAILFREDRPGVVKVSFRSDGIDMEEVVRHWNGGGHKYACGATIEGKMNEVEKEVLGYLKKVL